MRTIWGAWPLVHELAALWGSYHAARKALTMWNKSFQIIANVIAAVALAVTLAEATASGDKATAEAKKAEAIKHLDQALPNIVPSWMRGPIDAVLGMLIDQAVAWANSQGFFAHSGAASSVSSPA